jgi:UDP-N-acetylmuramate--alanine ligase
MTSNDLETNSPSESARELPAPELRVHFVGIAGAGMSALAEYRRLSGGRVSGSDRYFDQGRMLDERDRLLAQGVELFPQDGSGVEEADLLIASTAVEAAVPDLARARARGCPVLHRSELLALHVGSGPCIAVTGTSGKSTTVGFLFAALRAAGLDPGLLTGGELLDLRGDILRGNAAYGRGPLIIEADESDRSLVRYAPELALILNLHKDHLPADEVMTTYEIFASQARRLVIADDDELAPLRAQHPALSFGFGPEAAFRGSYRRGEEGAPDELHLSGTDLRLAMPFPGRHNASNALAALAAVHALDGDLRAAARGIASFRGIHRRFELIGRPRGVRVIDDFAHNPAKIAAALAAARDGRGRRLAFFQPHGFGPTKFFRDELIAAFAEHLGPEDRLWLAPIYYAGGSAVRDIASADLIPELRERGLRAEATSLAGIREAIAAEARAGDTVLGMGARDPDLHAFVRSVADALS